MIVNLYTKSSGRSPVEDFIKRLPKADRARFLDVITSLEDFGLACPRVQFKQIRGKLWEIKFKAPGAGYRILYVILSVKEMVLLHAFKKKTQKTPIKEIEVAERRMKEVIQ